MNGNGWTGKTRSRMVMLFWFFAMLFGMLGLRLFWVQRVQHAHYLAMAVAQQRGRVQLPALRGQIRDRNGVVLATSLARWSIAADPSEIKDVDATVDRLAPALHMHPLVLDNILSRPGTFAWVARKVPNEQARKVRSLDLTGIFLVQEPTPGRRFYPKGCLAAHLLGATGVDDQGLAGLEASYDKYLRGRPGLLQAFMDRDGWATLSQAKTMIKPAIPGRNLILTLDESIQFTAQQQLAKVVKEYKAKSALCIVMNARTGGILAMALWPGFNAADFASVNPAIRRNRCVTDPYEPGSTFKVFMAAAALKAGVKPSDDFRAGGVLNVGGWSIHNAEDGFYVPRETSMTDIMAYSLNVGAASIALHIGKKAFYKTLREFGFGRPTGIDLEGESSGILSNCKDWADINTATIAFGQGVAVTPIQLISGMQAVANGGVQMVPHVVQAIVDSDGNVVKRMVPTVKARPITPSEAADLRNMLLAVVQRGTGKLAQVPGFSVAGKTGTAQIAEDGVYAPGQYVASFLGFAPAYDPRVVVLVKVTKPHPYWGGLVAGPVFSRVMAKALWRLGVRPDRPAGKAASKTAKKDGRPAHE